MTDAVVGTVRLRGDGASRLARVAATALPAALDSALADLGDCRVESMRVWLDPDPFADDETIAVVWAGAIRAELLATGRVRVRSRAAHRRHADAPPVLSLADAVATARAWLASSPPRRPVRGSVLRAIAAALGSVGPSGTGDRVVDTALPPGSRAQIGDLARELVAALSGLPGGTLPAQAMGRDGAEPRGEPTFSTPDATAREATSRAPDPGTASGTVARASGNALASAEAAAQLCAIAELAPGDESLAAESLTRAAGLALLYPWLADHARLAVSLHPGLDGAPVRAHALAALVDPDDATLLDDPLIMLLAGVTEPLGRQVRLRFADEIVRSAEEALASFAHLLPGFGESSADFVRGEWVARRGALDLDADPVRLTAATHPLDVLLSQLPYPVGLFRLPWSPPVTVRFVP